MSLKQLLSPLLSYWPSFTALLGFYVLFKVLGSASFKGWFGEWMACRGLNRLDPQLYRQFHDLYLPRNTNSRLESHCQTTDRKNAALEHVKALNTRNA